MARAGEATRARAGDNSSGMSELALQLEAFVKRFLAGPDGVFGATAVLAVAAVLQTALFAVTGERAVAGFYALLATLPLLLARRRPLLAAALITFATFSVLVLNPKWMTLGGLVAQLAIGYVVATRHRRLVSVLLTLPLLLAGVTSPSNQSNVVGIIVVALLVAAQALGDARRERAASRQAVAHSRQEQALMEERARIARELHDVVAHHVSMVAVQAETARLTTPGMPEEGQERLLAIGDTAREALTEMRRLLGVLRADAAGDAERAPQPGLGELPDLIEGARAAGTTVRLTVSGPAAPLPPGVDLTAYRIVQEALTNARRHAPGAEVEVELRFAADALHLRVSDNGLGPEDAEPKGHGLLGMRERAAMVGGTLSAGRADGGGFAVDAELPL
jgi:signal transduction histidine kinase